MCILVVDGSASVCANASALGEPRFGRAHGRDRAEQLDARAFDLSVCAVELRACAAPTRFGQATLSRSSPTDSMVADGIDGDRRAENICRGTRVLGIHSSA